MSDRTAQQLADAPGATIAEFSGLPYRPDATADAGLSPAAADEAEFRRLLLRLLDLGYNPGSPQRDLADAPTGAIAWQVQSMLDDWADYSALTGHHAARERAAGRSVV